MRQNNHSHYYPICVAMTRRSCLVVGGGAVAQRKVHTLLRYGATVTVVSPNLNAPLRRWARGGQMRWVRRRFRPRDAQGQTLIYGATDDAATQQAIARAAARHRALVNIVDQPLLCTFIAPAQIQRGHLVIAVTTGGRAPGLAKRVRRRIERAISPAYARHLARVEQARRAIHAAAPTAAARKRALERAMDRLQVGR